MFDISVSEDNIVEDTVMDGEEVSAADPELVELCIVDGVIFAA